MKINTLAAMSAVALTAVGTTFAAEAPYDQWQFGVAVPVWAAGIDGNATVQGQQQDVNLSFSDLKDHLDASLSLGFEARKGKLGFYGGFGYMKFSADGTTAAGNHANIELKFLIADAGASYQLLKTESAHPLVLEGTLGVRYWYTDTTLSLNAPGGGLLSSGGNNRYLVDPMIGVRGSQYLTEKLHLDFAGDIGGFGVSDNSADLDWSATGLVTYDFTSWFSLSGGYKALAVNYSAGSGAGENGVDIIMNGALLVAKFKF